MSHRRIVRLLAVATLAVATSTTAQATHATTPWLSYDAALAAVTAPGFAGAWVEGGTLVVAFTHPNAAGGRTARADLARSMHRPDLVGMRVETRGATYSFRTLRGWYDALRADVFALDGVVSGDVDERANVLRFGATAPDAIRTQVAALAARHGVPAAAVVLEQRAAEVRTSLSDPTSPMVGGIRIDSPLTCSIGFPAIRNGAKGFVTAAHCTPLQGVTEGVFFYQPMNLLDPLAHRVAQETYDPTPSGTCQTHEAPCRRSDSVFATLLDEANFAAGLIAKPPVGSTAWNGTDTFRVTSAADAIVGETVWKVGKTTGLTSGTVSQTCADYTQNIDNLVTTPTEMECQTVAYYGGQGGDSGGTVFRITSGNDVSLAGVVWGGAVYSPISNIEESGELGPLSVCATGFSC